MCAGGLHTPSSAHLPGLLSQESAMSAAGVQDKAGAAHQAYLPPYAWELRFSGLAKANTRKKTISFQTRVAWQCRLIAPCPGGSL